MSVCVWGYFKPSNFDEVEMQIFVHRTLLVPILPSAGLVLQLCIFIRLVLFLCYHKICHTNVWQHRRTVEPLQRKSSNLSARLAL